MRSVLHSWRRLAVTFVAALATACLLPVTARAAVLADFNQDGVTDNVQISSSFRADGRVIVRISGLDPQILRPRDRVISIVAVDIDHDGDLDLGALSERHGLLIWLNKGGHGRFKELKKKAVARGHSVPPEAAVRIRLFENQWPIAQDAKPDVDPALRADRGIALPDTLDYSFAFASFCPLTDHGISAPAAPRAPPSNR